MLNKQQKSNFINENYKTATYPNKRVDYCKGEKKKNYHNII